MNKFEVIKEACKFKNQENKQTFIDHYQKEFDNERDEWMNDEVTHINIESENLYYDIIKTCEKLNLSFCVNSSKKCIKFEISEELYVFLSTCKWNKFELNNYDQYLFMDGRLATLYKTYHMFKSVIFNKYGFKLWANKETYENIQTYFDEQINPIKIPHTKSTNYYIYLKYKD